MNYYEHHLGDFKKDAAHLTMIQEGAYRRLIDLYYIREAPLPSDPDEFIYQLAGAHTKAERVAVDFVIEQFFKFDPTARVYRHKRCDVEIVRFRAKSESAKASANARWSHNGRNANGSANGMQSHSDGNALQSPVSNPQSPDIPTPTPPKGGAGSHRRISPDRAEKDAAVDVWRRLTASDGADPPRDHRLQAAIDAVGGWSRIRQREEGIDAQRVQRDFVDAYRSVS
jgi:uncharacterized protein YdaU (DUF1376 family)